MVARETKWFARGNFYKCIFYGGQVTTYCYGRKTSIVTLPLIDKPTKKNNRKSFEICIYLWHNQHHSWSHKQLVVWQRHQCAMRTVIVQNNFGIGTIKPLKPTLNHLKFEKSHCIKLVNGNQLFDGNFVARLMVQFRYRCTVSVWNYT